MGGMKNNGGLGNLFNVDVDGCVISRYSNINVQTLTL